jgi:hypothetical protein
MIIRRTTALGINLGQRMSVFEAAYTHVVDEARLLLL